ncbi:MAG: DUF2325 domain-containing protein [Candidatus Omnitrophica bacterium]|nr:DUF2325 domain-containing protein [Candidatus Omnitrophota bacterium]
METRTLKVILKCCIPIARLQQILSGASTGEDKYEAAAQEILNETEIGIQLSAILDQESHPQKAKIRGMKASELRKNLSIEFLEPGKTLGLILWALLSDERLSPRKLAEELAERFYGSMDASQIESPREEYSEEIAGSENLEEAMQDDYKSSAENLSLFLNQDMAGAEESSVEPVEINEELLNEVDDFIASLGEDSDSLDEVDAQSLLDDVDLDASEVESPGENDVITFDDIEQESSSPNEPKASPPVPTVQLGGITISMSSLKRACESVFNEPVELVTDENLTQQDRIVVVGRECGVRILHGPTWKQPVEAFRKSTGEAVSINPFSLKLALSKIYNEAVELIPDPQLLSAGRILFAGKATGLEIMENRQITVPLPDWVDGEIPVSPKQPLDDSEQIVSAEEKIAMLQMRLESLEQMLAAQSLEKEDSLDADVFNLHPESDAEEILIEESPETLEYSEPEMSEEELDEEISALLSEPGVSAEDSTDEEDIDLSNLDLEEISLDAEEIGKEADEDSFGEQETHIAEAVSLKEPSVEETIEEDLHEEPAPEDLTLSESEENALEEELEEPFIEPEEAAGDLEEQLQQEDVKKQEAPEIPEKEDEPDLDDLEDLDLESLKDYSVEDEDASEEQEESESETDDSEEELKDIDLSDILSELDADDESSNAIPELVFHDENILMLGGESKHKNDYVRVIKEIGGNCAWYAQLSEMAEGEIAGLVDQTDLIVTLSSDAITDPGILQAIQYAEENQKPVVQHHSSNPVSVQKQLVKIMSDEE